MKVYKIMLATEPLTWLLKIIEWIATGLSGNPYLYGMKIRFLDSGEIVDLGEYSSNNQSKFTIAKDLVSHMKTGSNYDTNKSYMLDYAKRAVIYANQDIRATSELDFFEDLIKLKHIEIILN